MNVNDITAHPKRAAPKVDVIPVVLHIGQAAQNGALIHAIAFLQMQNHLQIGLRVAQAVNRRHRGDDNHILALKQRLGGRKAHLFDMFIHRRVFLDEGVRSGDIGFRLVIIEVRHKILDRVVREKTLHFAVQLRRQRLVMHQHQGGALYLLNYVGNGEGLARTGDAEQRLTCETGVNARHKLGNRRGLVACGSVVGDKFEHLWIQGVGHAGQVTLKCRNLRFVTFI